MATRTERDSMGTMEVPESALYGAQTARALINFPISGIPFPRPFLRAIGMIKEHAAFVNKELGLLDDRIALSGLYASGGEQGSSFGIGTLPEQRRGSVAGLSLDARFWPDLLQAELDLGWSDYDPDTTDQFDAERDH